MQARPLTRHLRAYAQVESVAVNEVRAVEAAVVSHLVLPGERVRSGQVLAVLTGAQAQALLAARRSALRAASMQLAADRRKLSERLVTRQAVAADEAAYQSARGQLQVALETLTLRAPADGQVLAVDVADGGRVSVGQPILTLQTGRPWLKASYYGTDAHHVRPDMTGRFQPTSGATVPVRVRTVFAALGPDGGEQVGMVPMRTRGRGAKMAKPSWRSGEWGTVTLDGPTRELVSVPTRALILDRGRWWVLVRTARGDHRQRVIPGPSRGWSTFVLRGLNSGERVVVQNAYLEFHRGISSRYTPPDE